MPAFTFTMASGCANGAGFVDILTLRGGTSAATYTYELTGAAGTSYAGGVSAADLPLRLAPLANDSYTLAVNYQNEDNSGGGSERDFEVSCGTGPPTPGALVLDSYSATDETAALNDGTATIQASGGTAPLTAELVELSLSQPATSGQPTTFGPRIPPAGYTLRVTDSSNPVQVVQASVVVQAYMPPISGCQDEYGDNYNPAATTGGAASCTYTPRWRSAWQPMAVRVAAVAGQTAAFIEAKLRIGFRPGHPLAADRPLGDALKLRATVGPDGYATFVLGPYLHPQLGAPDGAGGYRLDLNSASAFDADLYLGYELRRMNGTLLEHGYALNSAVPDAQLVTGKRLTPFYPLLPIWPGFDDYRVPFLDSFNVGKYGEVLHEAAVHFDTYLLPCPPNPLPVRWLAPGGGYGYWVFQGKSVLGDSVSEGQQFREAATGELRFSDPGEAYQTYKASSGVFKGDALLTGLRTLWRSTQAWVQLGGLWVPIVVGERGSRDVGRLGVFRNEVQVSFQLAAPEFSQGQ